MTTTSTTQNHALGKVVRAKDDTYGLGEFIYLTGVASTVVGSVVTYNSLTGATALAPVGTNKPQPIAVAMSANVASQYGWYQIGGKAVSAGNGASGTGTLRVTVANDSTGVIGVLPVTSGGLSISRTVAAASTNATNIKASAGQVYGLVVSNVNASPRYVHLYNTAGTPTCTASIIATFIIPGNTAGSGTNIPMYPGVAFGTGIGICLTSAIDGTGNAAANDGVVTVLYK